ncbi:MAG: DUF4124 domain-containing protein [Betaproteobacteria bacterium]|nr:DUF4124 domain-containing protein [Betaproteobacteria bacterium]
MTGMRILFLGLLCISAASHAETTYYKCVVDGRTLFQDSPCPANASTKEKLPGTSVSSIDSGGSTGLREKAALDRIQTERRRLEIDRLVSEKEVQIELLDRQSERRLNELQTRIEQAYKEPYGARTANALAQEMQAVAKQHGNQASALRADIESLKAERATLAP